MAKSRPSVQKRRKEAARHEKKQTKAARREQRKAEKEEAQLEEGAVAGDPDLAGITPGPDQPSPWDIV